MTVGDASAQNDYRDLVYRVGSIYKAKSGMTELVEFEDESFSTVMQSCITATSSSGNPIKILADPAASPYPVDATITADSSKVYLNIQGTNQFRTVLQPAGDFPVFEFTDLSYFDINKISFYDTDVNRGDLTPFIKLINHCVIGYVEKCQFYQTQYKGCGIGGFVTGSSDYFGTECSFRNNFFRNGYAAFYWDSSATSFSGPWINGLLFSGNTYSGPRLVEKTNIKSGGSYSGNERSNEMFQSAANVIGGFDWDDAGSHGNNYHKNVFLWDLNYAGNFYAKLSPRDYLSIEGGSPTTDGFFIGSGIGNGAYVERRGSASYREGIYSASADGKTTDFVVTHGCPTTPKTILITPMSKDAAGEFYIYAKSNPTFTVRYTKPPAPATPTSRLNIEFCWEVKA